MTAYQLRSLPVGDLQKRRCARTIFDPTADDQGAAPGQATRRQAEARVASVFVRYSAVQLSNFT